MKESKRRVTEKMDMTSELFIPLENLIKVEDLERELAEKNQALVEKDQLLAEKDEKQARSYN